MTGVLDESAAFCVYDVVFITDDLKDQTSCCVDLTDQEQTLMKTEENVVMRTWKMEVGGHRKIGRPKLRWME